MYLHRWVAVGGAEGKKIAHLWDGLDIYHGNRTKEARVIARTLLSFTLATSVCAAGTIDPSVPDYKYLEYGGKHECVVSIQGRCENPGGEEKPYDFSASAVVVNPRWILTAAHFMKGSDKVRVHLKGREHRISKIIVHDQFVKEKIGFYDIALGMSEDEMALDYYPDLYEKDDEQGKISSICGYGTTGTFKSGSVRWDGKKRAGSNIVENIENHVLVCSATRHRKTSMDFISASGDSGGGLFIDRKIAGINSFVSSSDKKTNSDYGDESYHTRVSLFVPWIRSHIGGEAK